MNCYYDNIYEYLFLFVCIIRDSAKSWVRDHKTVLTFKTVLNNLVCT